MAYPPAPSPPVLAEPPGCCPADCDGFSGTGTLDGGCPGGAYPIAVSVAGGILTFDGSPYGINVSGILGSSNPADWTLNSVPCPPTTIFSVISSCVGGVPSVTMLLDDPSCSCTWSLSI